MCVPGNKRLHLLWAYWHAVVCLTLLLWCTGSLSSGNHTAIHAESPTAPEDMTMDIVPSKWHFSTYVSDSIYSLRRDVLALATDTASASTNMLMMNRDLVI